MYFINKRTSNKQAVGQGLRIVLVLAGLVLCIEACSKDTVDAKKEEPHHTNSPDGQGNENNQDTVPSPQELPDADKVSEYLKLEGADKIQGTMPDAMDGQVKLNSRDSIFIMKDFPFGTNVEVKHDGLYAITGMYLGVSHSSYYFDVPVPREQAGDSIDVIFINAEFPAADVETMFPLSFDVVIMPHVNGVPVKEFIRTITVEEPQTADSGDGFPCPITTPAGAVPPDNLWLWQYTTGTTYSGDLIWDAPEYKTVLSYQSGGCCNEDGTSTTVANDPYCLAKFSDGTDNPRWRNIDVDHYFEWTFDLLVFYDDGTFLHENESRQTNYRPSLSDFCNGQAAYDFVRGYYVKYGTHDFTPGADYLTVRYDVTDPPVFGKTIQSGAMSYTCHLLSLEYGREEIFTTLYQKQFYLNGKYRSWHD